MDLSFITEFISPIALMICLGVGYVLKNLITSNAINRFIPLISALIGLAVVCWANMAFTPEILATGLMTGLAATGLYEAFKNLIEVKDFAAIEKSIDEELDFEEEV